MDYGFERIGRVEPETQQAIGHSFLWHRLDQVVFGHVGRITGKQTKLGDRTRHERASVHILPVARLGFWGVVLGRLIWIVIVVAQLILEI
jgi:hypothetical protein